MDSGKLTRRRELKDGALVGCAIGIALPVYTMLDLPLMVGGKPIIAVPPIVVIAFEPVKAQYPEFREVLRRVSAERTEKMARLVLDGIIL